MADPDASLAPALERLSAASLRRTRRVIEAGARLPRARVDGREVRVFCSNDYLGLAHDPRLAEAMAEGARRWGAGSGAAHLVTGHTEIHHRLEAELAAFTRRERAVLFSTGYMANLGLVGALAGRHDVIVEDRLNHASLIDAARLSGARVRRYRHADPAAAATRLDEAAGAGRRLIVTDGVFSMDGDIAPLSELARVAARRDAWLIVDDAHGLGVVGATGGGSLEAHGLDADRVPALMGTLGKAFGGFGAFVAGSDALTETLIQRARTYVYTTAPPPAVAAVACRALQLAREEPWRRTHLSALVERFRRGAAQIGLRLAPSTTPIQPLLVGEPGQALAASQWLFDQGLWVTAIRPPTVSEGASRLRVTLSASHRPDDVDDLLDALARCPALGAGA
jgi:8-amino-7-oxononanoate synthase